ncbi:MAG: glutamate 5-kinase [Muribaculaceae bacterium]|nr:glutamate 5-kinase [Muribaculaceae bacterium]MDE5968942.1 glutamate 5-kinase [Muribaculaceae bacterium]
MKHYNRITVKIGSNVLTRPDGTLDVTRLSSLVDQIAALRAAGIEVVVISSGAVACGRSELRDIDTRRLDDVDRRQLFSGVGQAKLINRYYDLFRDHNIIVGQVLTLKESFATRRHYLNQRNCMLVMLANGVVPIVNENDTVSVTELMFTDNDELSGLVAAMLDCEALIILSNIDGIFDGNPSDPQSRVIEVVDPRKDISDYILTERSGFGRGGMVTKYRIARKVADEGIEVIIANGKTDNILTRLLVDDGGSPAICTRFAPSENPSSSMKRWIAHSEGFAKGRIIIDQNAEEAILSTHAVSILPIGVKAIEGDFERDDLVKIVSQSSGNVIGVGRVAYSSDEAAGIIGQRGHRPIVHYDYLYIDNI